MEATGGHVKKSGLCARADAPGVRGELGGCAGLLPVADREGAAVRVVDGHPELPFAHGCRVECGGGLERAWQWHAGGKELENYRCISLGHTMAAANWGGELCGDRSQRRGLDEQLVHDRGLPGCLCAPAPVGSFDVNRLGLYDLGGNVWEWCEDWYDGKQGFRVLRGASWGSHGTGYLLSSNRGRNTPAGRDHNLGFRCVLVGGASR